MSSNSIFGDHDDRFMFNDVFGGPLNTHPSLELQPLNSRCLITTPF
ncbi:hypothetical protein COLO4_04690 [Corchorus olitorius]|uniref:Uncharacterized protein n=1 Tax=Corchorus olitorius TaxID=93759 RepID=A0A1R3KT29_9ROSI|nr:hypothetical protein COLO4_04690 [Corchorus olitorius]